MLPELKPGWTTNDSKRSHPGLSYYIKKDSQPPYPTWLIDYDPKVPRAVELLSMWTREGTVKWITRKEYLSE